MLNDPQALNDQYALTRGLTFSPGNGGLTRAVIDTDACRAEVYLHGGHVTRWKPAGHDEVLWLSQHAVFDGQKAIRGGIPVCFPWFANNKPVDRPDAPAHGYARTQRWGVLETNETDGQIQLTLGTTINDYALSYRIGFGRELDLALTVTNRAGTEQTFEEALHTYFTVSQIRRIMLTGLEGAQYLHTVAGANTLHTEGDSPITFTAETDRVYRSAQNVVLHDPDLQRTIHIEKSNSDSTVVWNPWIDKAKAMSDFGEDEWPGMVCIESANITPNTVTLAPGATHTMTTTVRVDTPA